MFLVKIPCHINEKRTQNAETKVGELNEEQNFSNNSNNKKAGEVANKITNGNLQENIRNWRHKLE